MSYRTIILLIIVTLLCSCEEEVPLNTQKHTFNDDIADISALNGYFYTTNYDRSGHAGSQIDLLKYSIQGSSSFLDDRYELALNGQGYLAITNDGSNLFLQSRDTDLIMKYSPVGEKAYLGYDGTSTQWHPGGIAYNPVSDSLLALYRNLQSLNEFRIRSIAKDLTGEPSRDETFEIDFIAETYHGVSAMTYHDSIFYILAVDTSSQDILITLDHSLNVATLDTLSDSTVVGLSFMEDALYLSFRDRRIEWLKDH